MQNGTVNNQQIQANALMMNNLLTMMAATGGQMPNQQNANMAALLFATMANNPALGGFPNPNVMPPLGMPSNIPLNRLQNDGNRNSGQGRDSNDDQKRDRDRANDRKKDQKRTKPGPLQLKIGTGPDCEKAYHDPLVSQDCLKSLS